MIGSTRGIFWLLGYDDVVKSTDDPGCVLEDEIVVLWIFPMEYIPLHSFFAGMPMRIS